MDPADLSRRLRAVKELEKNPIWLELIVPSIEGLEAKMLEGLSNKTLTSDQRSTYLEGYHAAKGIRLTLPNYKELLAKEEKALIAKGEVADDDDQ
jgi:hypothetical protein